MFKFSQVKLKQNPLKTPTFIGLILSNVTIAFHCNIQAKLNPQFLTDHCREHHCLNVTTSSAPIITTEACIQPDPFDISCYIPDVLNQPSISKILANQPAFHELTMNQSTHSNQYDAIFTRKLQWVRGNGYKSLECSYFFHIFLNIDNMSSTNYEFTSIQSVYKPCNDVLESLLFCSEFGIIGLDASFNVYSLNSDLLFSEQSLSSEVSLVWNGKRGMNNQ